MGAVWLAERADGAFTQQVAVKLIRSGWDAEDVITRFRAERQILAGLQHPNIAHLVDGGVTPDGKPWLALEYIDGEDLRLWCDRRRLGIDARLRLFMHFVPVGPTETMIREISYALPDDRREMKAARYLNWMINRRVNAEDTELITRVQLGMQSPAYVAGPLGTSEVCLRSFASKLRQMIPEARLESPPPPGWSRLANAK